MKLVEGTRSAVGTADFAVETVPRGSVDRSDDAIRATASAGSRQYVPFMKPSCPARCGGLTASRTAAVDAAAMPATAG